MIRPLFRDSAGRQLPPILPMNWTILEVARTYLVLTTKKWTLKASTLSDQRLSNRTSSCPFFRELWTPTVLQLTKNSTLPCLPSSPSHSFSEWCLVISCMVQCCLCFPFGSSIRREKVVLGLHWVKVDTFSCSWEFSRHSVALSTTICLLFRSCFPRVAGNFHRSR